MDLTQDEVYIILDTVSSSLKRDTVSGRGVFLGSADCEWRSTCADELQNLEDSLAGFNLLTHVDMAQKALIYPRSVCQLAMVSSSVNSAIKVRICGHLFHRSEAVGF